MGLVGMYGRRKDHSASLQLLMRFSLETVKALCVLALAVPWILPASAKVSVQHLSQYAHTSWWAQDGLFRSPNAIAKTKDGYLWIGTDAGLVRFDGVRFVPWNTFPEGSIAAWRILSLFAAKDGSLWIGAGGHIARIKDEHVVRYDIPGQAKQFVEDDVGSVWFASIGTGARGEPICNVTNGNLRCYGSPELPDPNASALGRNKTGDFLIGGSSTLCQWSPGRPADCFLQEALKPLEGLLGVTSILTTENGTLWVGIGKSGRDLGLGQLAGGKWKAFAAAGLEGSSLSVSTMLEDREGSLWVGTLDRGLYRIHEGRAEHYGREDGLSSNTVSDGSLFEDQEGTMWVATSAGLDAFRRLGVSVFSTREGLPSDSVDSVLPARDGTVWFGNLTLSTLVDGQAAPSPLPASFHDKAVTSLLEDHAGRIWIGLDNTLNVYERGTLKPITMAGGGAVGIVMRMIEDSGHDVWIVTAGKRFQLFRIRGPIATEVPVGEQLGGPRAITSDPSGGIWLGFGNGALALYRDDVATMFAPDAISDGRISDITVGSAGTVLVTTTRGLLVQRGPSRKLLNAEHGLPCDNLQGIARDARSAVWLTSGCGIIEIDDSELQRWLATPDSKVQYRLLDVTDGVQPGRGSFTPHSFAGPDGRVWFANGKIAQVVDPDALGAVRPPPPVRIEEVIADRTAFRPTESVTLPSHTRDIEIRYTALSFVVPQKIKFQYRLEGRDLGWRDAGTLRQAFYTDLPPGTYRFRVKACNSDGVWNEAGASLDFEIPPAFYQTKWFVALCLAAAAAALYSFYLVRLKQVAARVRDRLAAKNAERERIARDLHDTLLQSTQGLILRVQAATNRLPQGDPTREGLEKALERADDVLEEGRDRVQDLRTSDGASSDLAQSLAAVGEELAREHPVEFRAVVEGAARDLQPVVKDETYRIGREALLNAFRHADACSIEVQIIHSAEDFRMRVRDDGRGIDTTASEAGDRPGHWGLKGMRERAQKIGAHLEIWSRPGSGTEMELTIPAAVAYEKRAPRFGWLTAWRLARE
jgi:signal transduction histidine kinase